MNVHMGLSRAIAGVAACAALCTVAAFGGFLIDHAGTAAALSVPPAVGLVAALVVAGRLATLRPAAVPAAV